MSIELERAVSSIRIGNRHRTDLGDIDALAGIDRPRRPTPAPDDHPRTECSCAADAASPRSSGSAGAP